MFPDRPDDGTASHGIVEVSTNVQKAQLPHRRTDTRGSTRGRWPSGDRTAADFSTSRANKWSRSLLWGRRSRTCTQTARLAMPGCNKPDQGRTVVQELDLTLVTDPAPFVEVAGVVHGVASTQDGRVLVTHESDTGVLTTAFDRQTGAPLVSGMQGQVVTALSASGRLVGADTAGDVTEFDNETLQPVAKLRRARGASRRHSSSTTAGPTC